MLPAGVQLVGLQTGGAGPLPARARVRLRSGLWGPWVSAAAAGHGPEQTAAGAARTGEPLWVGGARELQLRSAEPLERARLRLVTAPRGEPFGIVPGRAGAAALRLAQPVLAAGAGQPPIIARAAWARATQLPRVAPEYGEVKMAFVHHTENPNGYTAGEVPAMLRAIYAFHRDVNGWNDIGYNFVVDLFGRVFEARAGGVDEPVVGAHAGGYNLESNRNRRARVLLGDADLGGRTQHAAAAAGVEARAARSGDAGTRAGARQPSWSRVQQISRPRARLANPGSPGTATRTAPNAPATPCTASCRG